MENKCHFNAMSISLDGTRTFYFYNEKSISLQEFIYIEDYAYVDTYLNKNKILSKFNYKDIINNNIMCWAIGRN